MRFLICRTRSTYAGLLTEPCTLPGFSSELILCGPSVGHVIKQANGLGLYGVTAIELDQNDRPVGRGRICA